MCVISRGHVDFRCHFSIPVQNGKIVSEYLKYPALYNVLWEDFSLK